MLKMEQFYHLMDWQSKDFISYGDEGWVQARRERGPAWDFAGVREGGVGQGNVDRLSFTSFAATLYCPVHREGG